MHNSKHFAYVTSFDCHMNPVKFYCYSHFTDEENNFPKVIQLVKWQNLVSNSGISDFTDFSHSCLNKRSH